MRYWIVVLLTGLTLLSLLGAEQTTLTIATGNIDGVYFKLGKALETILEDEDSNLDVIVLQTSGSNENAKLINNKQADIAFMQNDVAYNYSHGEHEVVKKFNSLKAGIKLQSNEYNLESLINECENNWNEPEWGFPKGRRNFQEKDLTCALREFEEETGCNKNSLKIIYNIMPIEELFTGSNYKSYKHKYFIAYMDIEDNNLNNFQKTEVSKIEWKTYSDCVKYIRPYNLEKIDTLSRVNHILQSYKFF